MSDAILDSSAVLALILEEPGAEWVEAYLPGAKLSAVNLGEIVAKLRDLGMPAQTVEAVLDGLQIDVRPHDRDAALSAGLLRPATRAAGCRSATAPALRSRPRSDCPRSPPIAAGKASPLPSGCRSRRFASCAPAGVL